MIQVVVVKWGTLFGPEYVNGMFQEIIQHSSQPVRFVCITDDSEGLHPDIYANSFPDFGMPHDALKRGCFLKMSIFAPGILDPNLPTIYLDLDVAVVGDLARIAEKIKGQRFLVLRKLYLRGLWMRRLLVKKNSRYSYAGNNSMLGFIPKYWTNIFTHMCENKRMFVDD